ncbi:MAG TPA: hypothetical protein VL588_08380, partial [Bdellovibrionota bacterium]|nr:hypothetical protein [Bdellovibrionota bacterium]
GIRSLNKQVPSEGCCGPDASFPSNSLFNTPLTPTSGPGLGPFAEDHKKAARLEPAVYQVSDPAQTQPPFCTTPNY